MPPSYVRFIVHAAWWRRNQAQRDQAPHLKSCTQLAAGLEFTLRGFDSKIYAGDCDTQRCRFCEELGAAEVIWLCTPGWELSTWPWSSMMLSEAPQVRKCSGVPNYHCKHSWAARWATSRRKHMAPAGKLKVTGCLESYILQGQDQISPRTLHWTPFALWESAFPTQRCFSD